MAQTLNLTEQELKKLIIETYLEITDKNFVLNTFKKSKFTNWGNVSEQAYVEDGMAYLDPNQSMEANIKEVSRLQREIDDAAKHAKTRYYKGVSALEDGGDAWYNDKHVWLDILAAVLYISGAITTSVYGIGVILMGAAILVDLFNAYLYYQEDNYFMCGLTASFVIIPGINLAYVKGLFGPSLRAFSKIANNVMVKGGNLGMREIIKTLGRKTTAEITRVVKKHPFIIKTMQQATKWCTKMVDAFKSFIKWLKKKNNTWAGDWLIPDWVITALAHLKKVLTVVKETIKLLTYILVEMSIYDPGFTASILDWVGVTSAAEWFRKQPKLGLNWWSRRLEQVGNYKGAMTTTPYDCRGSVWTWEEIVEKFKVEDKYSNRDSASERRIWEKWTEDNWRPDPIVNDIAAEAWHGINESYLLFPELEQELKDMDSDIMRDCYYWSKAFNSEDKEIKNIVVSILDHIDTKYEE